MALVREGFGGRPCGLGAFGSIFPPEYQRRHVGASKQSMNGLVRTAWPPSPASRSSWPVSSRRRVCLGWRVEVAAVWQRARGEGRRQSTGRADFFAPLSATLVRVRWPRQARAAAKQEGGTGTHASLRDTHPSGKGAIAQDTPRSAHQCLGAAVAIISGMCCRRGGVACWSVREWSDRHRLTLETRVVRAAACATGAVSHMPVSALL